MITKDELILNTYYNSKYPISGFADTLPGIGYLLDGHIVACMLYEPPLYGKCYIHLAVDIPHPKWVKECILFLFEELNLKEVGAFVVSDNTSVIRLAETIGAQRVRVINCIPQEIEYSLKRNTGIHKRFKEKYGKSLI